MKTVLDEPSGRRFFSACVMRPWLLAVLLLAAQLVMARDDPAQAAAEYLLSSQLPDGFFPYDLDLATGESEDMTDMSGLNIVRQADAIYSLSEYYHLNPEPRLGAALRRGLQALRNSSISIGRGALQAMLEDSGLYNRWRLWRVARAPLDALGLLYEREGDGQLVSANGSHERAWPGATALAVLAELNYRRVTGDRRFADQARAWTRGLMALHVPGRGLREAPHYLSESAYVNGEAWLALARYASQHPEDVEVAQAVTALDDYLLERYTTQPNPLFYAWGTQAAASRLAHTGETRFLDFIEALGRMLPVQQGGYPEGPGNHCATLEGAVAYLSVMRQTGRLGVAHRAALERQIRTAIRSSLALQLRPGQQSIELADGSQLRSQWIAHAVGAFRVSPSSVRIQVDMTGHCLAAMTGMARAGLAVAE